MRLEDRLGQGSGDRLDCVRADVARRVRISDAEWAAVARAFVPRTLARKQLLLRQGEVCSFVGFVNRGCLRSFHTTESRDMTGHFFFDQTWVSDYYSFLTRTPSLQNIETLEESEVLMMAHANVETLYRTIPAWQEFGRLIAEEIYVCAHRRSVSFLIDSPEMRYQTLVAERPDVLGRVPQHIIASYLGVSPETLSRMKRRRDELRS